MKKEIWIPVVVALIGLLGVIITAVVSYLNTLTSTDRPWKLTETAIAKTAVAETALSFGATDTPSSPTSILPTETQMQPPTPVPTSSPTETQVPPPTIDSYQLSELEVRGLYSCILSKYWNPFSQTLASDQDGCWQLQRQGIYYQNGGILLAYHTRSNTLNGLYTNINQDVDIEFIIEVDKFSIDQDKTAYIGFGVQSKNNLQNGPVLMYYHITNASLDWLEPKIYSNGFVSSRVSNPLSLAVQQKIWFSIRGNLLSIYLDDQLCQSNILLPSDERVFTIRYSLPMNSDSEIFAFISKLVIKAP